MHRQWVLALPAVGLLTLAVGLAAVAQDNGAVQEKSTTDTIKAKASELGASIKRGAKSAEEMIKERYHRAKEAVVGMGVEARVYARLHWDKALSGSKIELSTVSGKAGAIKLTGTVADAKAKTKAVELTTDTVGVTEVVDNLAVHSSASTEAK
jgi:osmotically-inducible protein OsmY